MVSVASPGAVSLRAPDAISNVTTDFERLGDVRLTDATIETEGVGSPGGTVFIQGGRVVVDASAILSSSIGSVTNAQVGIVVEATEQMIVTNESLLETSTTGGPGNAGAIRITASKLHVDSKSVIRAATVIGGRAGDMVVEVEHLTLTGRAEMCTSTAGNGMGGTVRITATESVTITGSGSRIFSTSLGGSGPAGNIEMTAEMLLIGDQGVISSTTSAAGLGGDITLHTKRLLLTDKALIAARSTETGKAGKLIITVSDTLLLANSEITTQADLTAPTEAIFA